MSKLPIRLTDRPIIHFVKVVSFFRDTSRTSWFAITAPAATLAMTPCTTSRRRLATARVWTVTRRRGCVPVTPDLDSGRAGHAGASAPRLAEAE